MACTSITWARMALEILVIRRYIIMRQIHIKILVTLSVLMVTFQNCQEIRVKDSSFYSLSSCSPKTAQIINGEDVEDSDYKPGILQMITIIELSENGDLSYSALRCSATYIGEDWVMTAAHCLHPEDIEQSFDSDAIKRIEGVYFVPSAQTLGPQEVFSQPDLAIKVDRPQYDREIFFHPNYTP